MAKKLRVWTAGKRFGVEVAYAGHQKNTGRSTYTATRGDWGVFLDFLGDMGKDPVVTYDRGGVYCFSVRS